MQWVDITAQCAPATPYNLVPGQPLYTRQGGIFVPDPVAFLPGPGNPSGGPAPCDTEPPGYAYRHQYGDIAYVGGGLAGARVFGVRVAYRHIAPASGHALWGYTESEGGYGQWYRDSGYDALNHHLRFSTGHDSPAMQSTDVQKVS